MRRGRGRLGRRAGEPGVAGQRHLDASACAAVVTTAVRVADPAPRPSRALRRHRGGRRLPGTERGGLLIELHLDDVARAADRVPHRLLQLHP